MQVERETWKRVEMRNHEIIDELKIEIDDLSAGMIAKTFEIDDRDEQIRDLKRHIEVINDKMKKIWAEHGPKPKKDESTQINIR